MLEPTATGPAGQRQRSRPLLRIIIGGALRRTRLEQRRTLADVARAARMSMPYLSEVERGRKEASSEVLAAICEALRLDLSDLMADVWRELAEYRGRRTRSDRVVRLGIIGDRAVQGDAAPGGAVPPATIPDSSAPRSGQARCLLAA
jgi:transcriptional regulator with XRE-family HTH domain